MSSWILSIVGIVFLGVMLDIIYPNGKTNAFCKAIFGIVSIYLIISPLLNIRLDKKFDQEFVNSSLLFDLSKSKEQVDKLKIESVLKKYNIVGADVEIISNLIENRYEIRNIYIDISNLVLSENIENINKYEDIKNYVLEAIEIDPERIIIYG